MLTAQTGSIGSHPGSSHPARPERPIPSAQGEALGAWPTTDDSALKGPFDRRRPANRTGQALVEFALIALVLYLLLAAILTFGHLLYVAQGLQTAADLGARETSRTPLAAYFSDPDSGEERPLLFQDLLRTDPEFAGERNNRLFRTRIFDEALLVIDLNEFYDNFPIPPDHPHQQPNIFIHLVPTLPLLNQQLVPLMVVDRPGNQWLLHYPGALLNRMESVAAPQGVSNDPQSPWDSSGGYRSWVASQYRVGIPLIVGRDVEGVETIEWTEVVEEIRRPDAISPFSIANDTTRGIVALRINYPFQSASMSSFRPNPAGPFEPTIGHPHLAIDPGQDTRPPELLDTDSEPGGIYSGPYGLGAQAAFGKAVRPYRRVLSAQAIYRREIFE